MNLEFQPQLPPYVCDHAPTPSGMHPIAVLYYLRDRSGTIRHREPPGEAWQKDLAGTYKVWPTSSVKPTDEWVPYKATCQHCQETLWETPESEWT